MPRVLSCFVFSSYIYTCARVCKWCAKPDNSSLNSPTGNKFLVVLMGIEKILKVLKIMLLFNYIVLPSLIFFFAPTTISKSSILSCFSPAFKTIESSCKLSLQFESHEVVTCRWRSRCNTGSQPCQFHVLSFLVTLKAWSKNPINCPDIMFYPRCWWS